MHIHLRKIAFATLLSLSLYAYDSDFNGSLESPQLLDLVNSRDESILSVETTGEVYFSPSHLTVTEQGLYLRTKSHGFLRVPTVLSNQRGAYTLLGDATLATVYPVIKCKGCGLSFSPTFFNGGVCPHCGTQN